MTTITVSKRNQKPDMSIFQNCILFRGLTNEEDENDD